MIWNLWTLNNVVTNVKGNSLSVWFIDNFKWRRKRTNTNLSTFIITHECDLSENLWLIYIQNNVFTDKQYEQLKHDSGVTVINGVNRCKGRLVNSSLLFISNILYFFQNVILQS